MSSRAQKVRSPITADAALFLLLFGLLALAHVTLLRLPYFWDEAGYYIPAARDLLQQGQFIPTSVPSNAHPPLPSMYLALVWKLFGDAIVVTRVAMLAVAAFALVQVFRIGQRSANTQVAVLATLLTGAYPIWFVQSSLAHADLMAAAFTLWGIRAYVERTCEGFAATASRPGGPTPLHSTTKLALAFTLAALCKATAIATPLALLAWELIRRFTPYKSGSASFREKLALLLPVLPVAAWFWYHKAETGFIFGNPEFYRYNVSATADLLRIGLAFVQRIWHLFGHMNMIALTAAGMIAMFWPALRDAEGKRQRMAVPIQLAFAAIVLANLLAFSILGGALLTRYLLPLYPLVILVWLSTLRRRLNAWLGLSLMICGLFIVALFINPPYRFAPEDNLSYREYILLHKRAAGLIEAKHANDRVLTAWPASDELRKPFLGYVAKPVTVTTIQNFSLDQIATAAQAPDTFDTALLFSTKYEPDRPLLRFRFWDRIHEKYFDYHQDIPPELAAQMLGGQIIHKERRAGFWIAIVEIPKIRLAAR